MRFDKRLEYKHFISYKGNRYEVATIKPTENEREMIVTIYADATGKDPKDIEKAIDRDNWMSPIEAKEFGLIDKVIDSYKDLE